MKKKALIYALLASVLVGTVASCDDKNNNNNNIVNVDPTPKEDPKKEEPDNPKKEEPETPKYNFEDNEESKKVYEEFSKYFTNVSYEDFLLNAKKSSVVGGILFEYKELSVTLNFDGSLKLKSLISVDGNKKTSTEYKYLNNEWVKTKETLTINDKELTTYLIGFKADDSYYGKDEYTYDENGNQLTNVHSVYENDAWIYYSKSEKTYDESGSALTLIESRYLNNEWVKISEDKYINGEEKNVYSVYVDVDGKITGKNEYTYDENGNELSGSYFKYSNNEWIEESGFITFNGERKRTRDVYYEDGILNQIHEYAYDENGNQVKEVVSSLINNEWVKISEYKRINGELKPVLYYLFNNDGSISSKNEQTYDEFGNTLTGLTLKYLNNSWINSHKFEYTYDASGKKLTETSIFYENNELDSKYEYLYDSNGNKVEVIRSKYINNNWALSSKYEYTYDENGSELGNKEYIYLNNQWIKRFEYKYIEGKIKRVYSLNLNEDNTFNFKTEYTYDSKGNVLSSISSNFKNNNWILSSKEEYEYDEAGNELGNKRYNYISNQWVKVFEYKYINGERKIICFSSINDNLVLDYIYDCILDEDGNEIAHITTYIVDNELSEKIESKIDKDINKKYGTYYDYENGTWIENSKYEELYDSNENLLEHIQYKLVNSEFKKDTSTKYRYENNNLIEKEEYKYDETGKVLSITYSKYVNKGWTLDSKIEYTYDEKGNELTFDFYKYIKERWIRCSGYMFIAGKQITTCNPSTDETGKLTDVTEYKYDDKASMISMTTIHFKDEVYDSKDEDIYNDGKLVERVSSNYKNYRWEEDKKEEYAFDETGNLSSVTTSIYLNVRWVKKQVLTFINGSNYETYILLLNEDKTFDSQIETKYDSNGKKKSETISKFMNNKWEKTLEFVYINDFGLISLKVDTDENGTFKEEHEFDENGNEIVYIYSKFINNNWWRTEERREYKYHPNGQYSFTAIIKYKDNKYFSKEEIEQDKKGIVLNRINYEYVNSDWVQVKKTEFDYTVQGIYCVTKEYTFINGTPIMTSEDYNFETDSKRIYLSYLNAEGKYISEYFWEYYDNWNEKTYTIIEFRDGNYFNKTETTYDEEGNKSSYASSKYINGEWIKTNESIYINGESKHAYNLEFKQDGSYDYKWETKYDENGNKLISSNYRFISNIWIKAYEYVYINGEEKRTCVILLNEDGLYDRTFEEEYDETGVLLRKIYVIFENNEVKEKIEVSYDSNGNKTSEIHYDFENGEWVKNEAASSENKIVHKKEDVQEGVYKTIDETYDKNDKLISAIEIYYWNEKPSKKTEITYNDDGNVAYAIAYDYVNDEWALFEQYNFTYVDSVLISLVISSYVNNAWIGREKHDYVYDENGNKIEEHDSKYVNGKWIVCEKLKKINGQEQLKLYYNLALNEDGSFNNQWESEYDENGNELLNIYQEYVNGEWVNKSKQEYAYDENGNLLSTIYSVYINETWNYKDKFEFTYDKDGNRTSEKKYSYQNGQWVLEEHN